MLAASPDLRNNPKSVPQLAAWVPRRLSNNPTLFHNNNDNKTGNENSLFELAVRFIYDDGVGDLHDPLLRSCHVFFSTIL